MELQSHPGDSVVNGVETIPDVVTEVTDTPEWPERSAQAKAKKSKLTSSQARVSHLLDMLGEVDAKRLKLEAERDELKKQLATAVTHL